jgi:hypothetical protein
MIYDKQGLFSDAQAITADAGSTNTIDLGATGTPYGASAALIRDIGKGDCGIPISITVTETFNNLTSLQVSVQTDDNSGFSSPSTRVLSELIPLSGLTAGSTVSAIITFPEGTKERYVRLFYDVTGTAPTTGKITAGVVAARQTNFVGGQ